MHQTYSRCMKRIGKDVRYGKIDNSGKYWLTNFNLMRLQHQIYTAVQPSDFNMRSDAWNKRLTYYLAFNKTNYARYWTWYRDIGLYRDIGVDIGRGIIILDFDIVILDVDVILDFSKSWKRINHRYPGFKELLSENQVFQWKPKLHIQFEHQLIKKVSSLSNEILKHLKVLLSFYSITIYLVLTQLCIFNFKVWSTL